MSSCPDSAICHESQIPLEPQPHLIWSLPASGGQHAEGGLQCEELLLHGEELANPPAGICGAGHRLGALLAPELVLGISQQKPQRFCCCDTAAHVGTLAQPLRHLSCNSRVLLSPQNVNVDRCQQGHQMDLLLLFRCLKQRYCTWEVGSSMQPARLSSLGSYSAARCIVLNGHTQLESDHTRTC